MLKTFRLIMRHPLSRDRKLAAAVRFAWWQIHSRLRRGPIPVSFVNDSKLVLKRGMRGATGNVYFGLHEFEEMGFILHTLRRNELFVDVGANVGSYTILASAGIGARTISIEPIASTFDSLRKNVQYNKIEDRVELLNIGIGASEGKLQFIASRDSTNRVAREEDQRGDLKIANVPVRTLDHVVGDQSPTIIKIDVEGFETEVIAGSQGVLQKESLIAVLMETDMKGSYYGFDEKSLLQQMRDAGFTPCKYDPFTRKLEALRDFSRNVRNAVLVRNIEQVQDRVSDSRPFRVHGRTI